MHKPTYFLTLLDEVYLSTKSHTQNPPGDRQLAQTLPQRSNRDDKNKDTRALPISDIPLNLDLRSLLLPDPCRTITRMILG